MGFENSSEQIKQRKKCVEKESQREANDNELKKKVEGKLKEKI